MSQRPVMTTAAGVLVGDNQNSLTAGPRGPVLMDYPLTIKGETHANRSEMSICS